MNNPPKPPSTSTPLPPPPSSSSTDIRVNKQDIDMILQGVIAQLCIQEGVDFINEQSIDLLTQVLSKELQEVARSAKSITTAANRSSTNSIDMIYALNENGIKMNTLSNYIATTTPIPPLPIPQTSTQHLLHPEPQYNVTFSQEQFGTQDTLRDTTVTQRRPENPQHVPPYLPSPPNVAENTIVDVIAQRHTETKRQNTQQ